MVSSASLAQLRISQEDLLEVDDLLYGDFVDPFNSRNLDDRDVKEGDEEWEQTVWIRHRMSDQGHRLSPDRETAYCGFPLVVDEYWYETEWRPLMKRLFDKDPGDWFLAIDTRKGKKCSPCKPHNAYPDHRFLDEEAAPRPEPAPPAIFVPQSPAEEREHMKFLGHVAWIAREFDADIL